MIALRSDTLLFRQPIVPVFTHDLPAHAGIGVGLRVTVRRRIGIKETRSEFGNQNNNNQNNNNIFTVFF